MPQFIPELSEHIRKAMTAGERKTADFLREYLAEDCIVWYNVPMGKKRLYADFLVLFPNRGLLCLEVKDWAGSSFRRMTQTECEMVFEHTVKTVKHPLEQARGYMFQIIDLLSKETRLQHTEGEYKGRLRIPYTHGVVFTRFNRSDIAKITDIAKFDHLMPHTQTLYKDDLKSGQDNAHIADKLAAVGMRIAAMTPDRFADWLEEATA